MTYHHETLQIHKATHQFFLDVAGAPYAPLWWFCWYQVRPTHLPINLFEIHWWCEITTLVGLLVKETQTPNLSHIPIQKNHTASTRGTVESMTSISDHAFTEASCSFKLRIPSPNGVGTRHIFLELRSEMSLHCYDRLMWMKFKHRKRFLLACRHLWKLLRSLGVKLKHGCERKQNKTLWDFLYNFKVSGWYAKYYSNNKIMKSLKSFVITMYMNIILPLDFQYPSP